MQIHEFYFMVRVERMAEAQRKYPRATTPHGWPRWLRRRTKTKRAKARKE
jgi:hypothetical protein